MAFTAGLVQQMSWASNTVSVWVGPSRTSAELLTLLFGAADTREQLAFKRSAARLLAVAQLSGHRVTVGHPDSSAEVLNVSLGAFEISPVGQPVHRDFYSITGSDIPADVKVVFESQTAVVTVTPDLIRPHWVLIADLPAAIPLGRNMLTLEAPGWTSEAVPVDVSAGPVPLVRVLYSGQPKTDPYQFVFVANPAILTESGALIADPILMDRISYLDEVAFCLQNLLTVTEDLLRQSGFEQEARFVSVYDASLPAIDANSLAHELDPNLMETRRAYLNGFLSGYTGPADLVFVLHGSTTHNRATAWFTTDDASKPGTVYTYDGMARTHGHFSAIPGSAALPLSMRRDGLTPIHEFGHAGSDFNNGKVIDLYVDDGIGINKKQREQTSVSIPADFAEYNGTTYDSDPTRDSIGYPWTWVSYHPILTDALNPNLMDNYNLAPGGNKQLCRLDQLTYVWFSNRLRAKLTR